MRTNKLTLLVLIFCFGISSITLASAHSFKESGANNNPKTSHDTSIVNEYARKALSFVYYPMRVMKMKADIDTAESICNKDNIEFPALLHLARAEYFFMTGDFKSASQEAAISEKKSVSSEDNPALARTLNFLGRYSHRTGFYKESIDYFNKSIDLAGEKKIRGIIPMDYYNMSEVFYLMGDMKEYRNILQKTVESSSLEHDTMYLEIGYFRWGTSFTDKDRNFHHADSLLRKGLEISLIKKDTTYISLALANLGWNFYLEKKYTPAINSYNRALSYSLPAKRYEASTNSFGNLGTIYRDLGDTEKSLKYYLKAIEEGNIGNDIYNRSWVYHDMSDMYLIRKDTANAFKSFVMFKKFSDSLLTSNSSKGLNDAKIRYDAETENKEFQLLSLRVSNQRLLIYGYTGLFVLCLAIGILIFSRAKINAKRRMSEMNRKISEITQANLRQQMNPHFIFNTLNSIQYYMYQHDKLATNNYLTKFSSLMRKVLENSQHTSVSLRDELEALRLYLELEMIRFKDKFDYEITVDDEIDTLLYKVPTMLIQPYVENSISHGLIPCEGKGLVKIDLKLENEYISCTIEDNGIGRDAAQEQKRKKEVNHNSLGTQIVASRLELVNALYGTSLKTIYTDLKSPAGDPEGTLVKIQIPIMT
jgi:two-component system, LytTR family, sensor kinase